jgi:hypothetical protein
MAAYFWVTGGTGNWNDASNWALTSGGIGGIAVPGSGDTATLDANSGAGSVTLDISPDIQTLTCTGFTGTLAFGTNTISLNSTGTIFTGATTMTVTGTPQIIATNSTATARTIAPTAVTEANSISFRITAGTGTFSVTAGALRNLDFTDGSTSAGFGGAYGSSNITIYGDLKFSTSGMTLSDATGTFTFAATSGTKTITPNGVATPRPFTFNGVGGTWQLQGALTSGSTRACTLTNGTLDLNGYTATFGSVSSNNSNVRTFAFGSTGKFVLTNTAATLWTTSTSTNLTVTGTNPLIQLTTNSTTGTRGVILGAAGEANSISVDVTAGSDQVNLSTTNGAYRNVNFTGFTGTVSIQNSILVFGNWNWGGTTLLGAGTGTVAFSATSGTKTITSNGFSFPANVNINGVGGAWNCTDALSVTNTLTMINGTLRLAAGTTSTVGAFNTSGTNPKFLLSATPGTPATISDASGTNTVSYLTVQDNIATGGAVWDALDITNVDAGDNTGWLFSTTPSIGNEITMRLRSFTQPRRF